MMPLQPQLIVLQQPDGLYPLVVNFRIQDTLVELIGTRTSTFTTGVIQSSLAPPRGVCGSVLGVPTAAAVSRLLTGPVPSGV